MYLPGFFIIQIWLGGQTHFLCGVTNSEPLRLYRDLKKMHGSYEPPYTVAPDEQRQ